MCAPDCDGWCVSWPVSVTMRVMLETSIRYQVTPPSGHCLGWKFAGTMICCNPALNNNTSQSCSCGCFKCYHCGEETMNFCLQIWLECSEWPHTKLFLALVITIEPWLPPQPSLLEYIESCISITINNVC